MYVKIEKINSTRKFVGLQYTGCLPLTYIIINGRHPVYIAQNWTSVFAQKHCLCNIG